MGCNCERRHREQRGNHPKGRIRLLSRSAACVLTGDEFTEALEEDGERVAAEAELEVWRAADRERRA